MIFPPDHIDDWCKKYNLKIERGECSNCGKPVITNIPFIGVNNIRGIKSSDHGCGERYTWKVFNLMLTENSVRTEPKGVKSE